MAGRKRKTVADPSRVGVLIQAELERRNWTAARLAEEAEMSEGSMSDLLNGRTARPKVNNLISIAEALGDDVHAWTWWFDQLVEATTGAQLSHTGTADQSSASVGKLPANLRQVLEQTPWAVKVLDQLASMPLDTRRTALAYLDFLEQQEQQDRRESAERGEQDTPTHPARNAGQG